MLLLLSSWLSLFQLAFAGFDFSFFKTTTPARAVATTTPTWSLVSDGTVSSSAKFILDIDRRFGVTRVYAGPPNVDGSYFRVESPSNLSYVAQLINETDPTIDETVSVVISDENGVFDNRTGIPNQLSQLEDTEKRSKVMIDTLNERIELQRPSEDWILEKTDNKLVASETGSNKYVVDNIDDTANIRISGGDKKLVIAATDTQVDVDEVGGTHHRLTILDYESDQSKDIEIFKNNDSSMVINYNEHEKRVIIYGKGRGVEGIRLKVDDYRERECPEISYVRRNNLRGEFKVFNETIKFDLPPVLNTSQRTRYAWPGCFELAVEMQLPLELKENGKYEPFNFGELATQFNLEFEGSRVSCPAEHNCLPEKCLFTDLCKQSHSSKNIFLSDNGDLRSDLPACNTTNGRFPWKVKLCPKDRTFKNKMNIIDRTYLEGYYKSDLLFQLKVWKLKTKLDTCPDLFVRSKLQLLGCHEIRISYTLRIVDNNIGIGTLTGYQNYFRGENRKTGAGVSDGHDDTPVADEWWKEFSSPNNFGGIG